MSRFARAAVLTVAIPFLVATPWCLHPLAQIFGNVCLNRIKRGERSWAVLGNKK